MSGILIIDNDDLELDFIKEIIKEELGTQYKLQTCIGGRHAVKMARHMSPDIIIMDIMLSDMDGMDAAEEIIKMLPDCCISILTACADFHYARRAIHLHMFDYMLKPVRPDELKKTLKSMISFIEGKSERKNMFPVYTGNDIDNIEQKNFIEDSIQYIQEHYRERLKLSQVASRVYMNTQYFSRVFKRELGISFTEYVNQLKIKYACQLLETTNYPAYRIASECGFTDPSYFNRVFCLYMNQTPQKYKKSYKMEKDNQREKEEAE